MRFLGLEMKHTDYKTHLDFTGGSAGVFRDARHIFRLPLRRLAIPMNRGRRFL